MDAAPETNPRLNRRAALLAAALVAAYWLLAVAALGTKSATYDEGAYVAGGYAMWARHDYRLNAEGGHLSQRVAALPLLLAGPKFPDRDHPSWQWADVIPVARTFLYESGNDTERLLFLARAATATVSALTGLLVFAWARRLFGTAGGFVSLTLFAFCPTMLANAPIPQSDLASALFFLAAVAGLWGVLHRLSPLRVLVSCAAVSGLFLAKLSAPVLAAIGFVLAVVRLIDGRPLPIGRGERLIRGRWRLAFVIAGLVALHAVAAWFAIWAAFGFRFAAFNDSHAGSPELMKTAIRRYTDTDHTRWARGPLMWTYRQHMLPEAYLFGVAFQVYHTSPEAKRLAYLNGEVYEGGRPAYFPFSFAVKTPLPLFALLPLAAWAWLRARPFNATGLRRPTLYDLTPLLALVAVFALVAVRTPVNIGHRYLAPVYPPLFVLTGAAGLWWRPSSSASAPGRRLGWRAVAVAVLVVGFAVESLLTWPNYLAYFNPLVGGPESGWRHLADSSLDWGQDLPGLRKWLDERGLPSAEAPVYLAYFGTASVRHFGIRAAPLFAYPPQTWGEPGEWRGGVYCVSATLLVGLYVPPEDRFSRLCAYLRTRTPDDHVGHSILIFRLTDDEARAALAGGP